MTEQTPQNNYLDMPDEQVMGMSAPAEAAPQTPPAAAGNPPGEAGGDPEEAQRLAAEQQAAEAGSEVPGENTENGGQEKEEEAGAGSSAGEGGEEEEGNPPSNPAAAEPAKSEDPAAAKPAAGNPEDESGEAENKNTPASAATPPAGEKPAQPAPEPTPDDHKAFYERILGRPIKANGKEIQLRSPEEAERLIQMGLNYTKKMQAWQPRIRVVTMLENNGLLDEAKLSHLIDVSKGDPLAIQKLLSDINFDPMTVDAEKAASYKPGNHQVTDAEVAFNAVLDDIESTDTGVELITEVAKQWDEQSRQAVYRDPGILRVINEQKALGLYARITAEMDHLRNLGQLQGVPFLQAYKAVGDMLNDQGRLQVQEPQKQAAPPAPVETRVAKPAPKVSNNEKAAAASPTKATPATPRQEPNYLDVPDEQFLKEMQGRL